MEQLTQQAVKGLRLAWRARHCCAPAGRDRLRRKNPNSLALRLILSGLFLSIAPLTSARADQGKLSIPTNASAAAITMEYGQDGLRLNFHGASLNLVLEYLSDAAGFVINKQTDIRGSVEVWSKQPVTKAEAIELLSSVLKQNGYALTRNGRILTIVSSDNVKTADTEIAVGADPAQVNKSNEVQTQIIPVRYATVSQLVQNLQILLPSSATLSANESANTLILVATKTDIRRMLQIIQAMDNSMATVSSIHVRLLRYADAKETANIITQLFAQQTTGQPSTGGPANFGFGGGPGGGPFGGGPGGGFLGGGLPGMGQANSRSSSGGRGSMAPRVVAVADDRSNAVIVSATPEMLASIENMLDKLDQQIGDLTEMRVFRLTNAEPAELADQLAQLFPDETNSGTGQNGGNFPFFFPGGGGLAGGRGAGNNSGSSEHMKKTGRVLAVPDGRTSSLIVTAAKTLMPQIAGMIASLDADQGKREIVSVFELRNADPQDISQNLQDLFNRNSARSQNDQNSFLGRNHPLTQRQLQNQQSTSAGNTGTSGLGSQLGSGTGGRTAP